MELTEAARSGSQIAFDGATDDLHRFRDGLRDAVDQLVDTLCQQLEVARLVLCRDTPIDCTGEHTLDHFARFVNRSIQCTRFHDSLSDIATDAHEARDGAARVAHGYLGGLQMHEVARRIAAFFFPRQQRLARADHRLLVVVIERRQLLGMEVEIVLAQQIVGRLRAHDARHRHIGQQEAAVDILDVDEVGKVVDERSQHRALARRGHRPAGLPSAEE
jgi:hypothetical protein